jgi:sterol desaturase/sphingolipid hydroxylase (fatty acid hydroxylase superfamily)
LSEIGGRMGRINRNSRLPGWLGRACVVAAFVAIIIFERRRPLRSQIEPNFRHDTRNLLVAAAGAFAISFLEKPVAESLSQLVTKTRLGLTGLVRSPLVIETALAIALLDYTLYVWHILTHKVPLLWRFHLVHHVDLDMNVTTALRFHFGEVALSVPWRAAQVVVIGVSPLALSIWQTLLLISIMFHHSNVRLPLSIERVLSRLIVTPRLHGIHHSVNKDETDSNWSSGLTVWDRLHGTLKQFDADENLIVGVPTYRNPEELTAETILIMPFCEEKPAWVPEQRRVRTQSAFGAPKANQYRER